MADPHGIGGRCTYDHNVGTHMPEGLEDIPLTPIEPCQLILMTEMGPVPYCGIDNERALAASRSLGERYVKARLITDYSILPGDDYLADLNAIPHLVLSAALAEKEGRLCIAEWAKTKVAEMSQHARPATPDPAPQYDEKVTP